MTPTISSLVPSNKKQNLKSFLSFTFVKDKKEGRGEDAEPCLYIDKEKGNFFIGVFDGLGGSGSTKYTNKEGETKSGAFIASRLASKTVDSLIRQHGEFESGEALSKMIKDGVTKRLVGELDRINSEPSKIRSSLIKSFPTTFAGLYFSQEFDFVSAIWAGDSRCYLFHHKQGLIQLSKDDLRIEQDALQNIIGDQPLSNYINADSGFKINYLNYELWNMFKFPTVFFVASDGCFGYYQSPMHFEYVLLETLAAAKNMEGWGDKLENEIAKIAGDDISCALVGWGWQDFQSIQKKYEKRNKILFTEYIEELDILLRSIEEIREEYETIYAKVAKSPNSNTDHNQGPKGEHDKSAEEKLGREKLAELKKKIEESTKNYEHVRQEKWDAYKKKYGIAISQYDRAAGSGSV